MLQAIAKRRRRPQAQRTAPIGTPAPFGGILANKSVYGEAPEQFNVAIELINLIPGEYGVRIRPGSQDFATAILDASAAAGDVRTVLIYRGLTATQRFAATSDGIYNITAGGAGPHTKAVDWATKDTSAGYCSSINWTNEAGTHYLLVCDESNGYYTFDGTTWAAGAVTGVANADLVYVTDYQNRVVFIERDTANSWYLATDSFAGAATKFAFGSRFRRGGALKQITNWSLDDSAGIDDRLVALSDGGDVTIYSGDLSSPTLIGTWSVGIPPAGRRAMTTWRGDVLVTSDVGSIRVSSLLEGNTNIDSSNYVTRNISRPFRKSMSDHRDAFGWQFEIASGEGIAIMSVPKAGAGQLPIQYVLNTQTGAWCEWHDLDILCMAEDDDFFFGTTDGRVMKLTGTVDDLAADATGGSNIDFELLTHFSHFGQPTSWKRCQFLRPSFIGDAFPQYLIQARYDFDLSPAIGAYKVPPGAGTGVWDVSEWDVDTWVGGDTSFITTQGLSGMGRHIAIVMSGKSGDNFSLVGFDLMIDMGGQL